MNLLFICSRNKWRSRTAETIFKTIPGYSVQSAGTSKSAEVRLSSRHLAWADKVFVMETKHRQMIQERFPEFDASGIVVLHLPDEYQYMDLELIALLKDGVSRHLKVPL